MPDLDVTIRETPLGKGPGGPIPGLTGLRALACLAVFGVHFQQITGTTGRWGPFDAAHFLANGNTGVCLFFLLSGFLLSLPFWRHDNLAQLRGKRWLWGYACRRFARIGPAYYVCLAVLVIHQQTWLQARGPLDIALHATLLHNLAEFSLYGISQPFWALAVLGQFYVAFPFIALVMQRLANHRAMLYGCLITATFLAYIAQVLAQREATGGYVPSHSLLAHLPHFLLGILTAGLFVRTETKQQARVPAGRIARWLPSLGFWTAAFTIPVILAVPKLDEALQIPYGRYNLPYVPVLVAVLIATAKYSRSAGAFLDWSPLRWLGAISYGVYIYHLPCLRMLLRTMNQHALAPEEHKVFFAAAGLALSCIVAGTSYVLVERPILRRFKSPTPS